MREMAFVLTMMILSACADYKPVVDPQSVQDTDQFYRDQAECEAIARQGAPGGREVAKGAVVGGAVGTGTGALLGTIAGDTVEGLAYGAVIGGLAGGARGTYKKNEAYENIYRNCMYGRGYKVLN